MDTLGLNDKQTTKKEKKVFNHKDLKKIGDDDVSKN